MSELVGFYCSHCVMYMAGWTRKTGSNNFTYTLFYIKKSINYLIVNPINKTSYEFGENWKDKNNIFSEIS